MNKKRQEVGRALFAFVLAVVCGGGSIWLQTRLAVTEISVETGLFLWWLVIAFSFVWLDGVWQRRVLKDVIAYVRALAAGET